MYCDDKLVVMDDADERCKFYENICGQKAVALGERFWTCGYDSAKMLGVSFDKELFAKMCDDVRREFGKAQAWIGTKPRRVLNRPFFVNWLNRIEAPVKINGESAESKFKSGKWQ